MASRDTTGKISLPGIDRRSVAVGDLPQVDIPLLNGGAARLVNMGAISREAGLTVSAIDRKNQEVAAEKQFTSIFLEAQKEINDFHATATGDEDISGQTLSIYDKYMNGLEERGLPSVQADIIRKKLNDRQAAIGQMGLNFELELKAKKYDADLSEAIENSANIVAGDPRLFGDQLKNVEGLIETSRLNGAEKADKLNKAKEMMGQVYLTKLTQNNPALARKEIASGKFDGMISPTARLTLDSMIESRFETMENRAERARKKQSEANAFELYNRIIEPRDDAPVSRQGIVDLVRSGDLKPSDGRTLINLMMSDDAKEDDLGAFAELARKETLGELTPEDVIAVHTAGNLKTSTAKSLISGITTGINSNETYKTGRDLIKAEFDKSEFGITKSGSAAREVEALREFQRRAVAPAEGETIDGIADEIVNRLRKSAQSDMKYKTELADIKAKLGVPASTTTDVKVLRGAAKKVREIAARGGMTTDEMHRKLNVLARRIGEIERGAK